MRREAPASAPSRILCMVPACNEADRIAETVKALYQIPGVGEVLVVDDGSTDSTARAAEDAGATVLRLASNVGKGGALDAALDAALDRRPAPDTYLLVDGDVGETAAEAAALAAVVAQGAADLAIGRLPVQSRRGLGTVKRMAAWMIRRASGFEAREPLSGQRAVRAAALQACRPLARGFGVETGMTIDAVRLGYRVVEIDVAMRHRATGLDLPGFLHRGRQGLWIAWAGLVRLARLR